MREEGVGSFASSGQKSKNQSDSSGKKSGMGK
jgi:hypothetical protein